MNEVDKKRLEEMQAEARTVPLSEKERWLIAQLEDEAAEVKRLMVLGVRYSDERIAAETTCQSLREQSSCWEAQALEAGQEIERLKLEHDYEITVLDDARKAAESEAAELHALFALQRTRMAEATRAWQVATGKHDVLPDLGDLLGWLMSDAARQRERAGRAEEKTLRILRRDIAQKCFYCAWETPAGGEAREDVQVHIRECPANPLRAAEARIKELERDFNLYRVTVSVHIEKLEARVRELRDITTSMMHYTYPTEKMRGKLVDVLARLNAALAEAPKAGEEKPCR